MWPSLCVSCLLGFASLTTLMAADTSPAPTVLPLATLATTTEPTPAIATQAASTVVSIAVQMPTTKTAGTPVLTSKMTAAPASTQNLSSTPASAVISPATSPVSNGLPAVASALGLTTLSSSKPSSVSGSATLSSSTATASTSSQTATSGPSDTGPSKSPLALVGPADHSSTATGPTVSRSSATKQAVTTSVVPTPGAPTGKPGPSLSLETSKPTSQNLATATTPEITSKSKEDSVPPRDNGNLLSSPTISTTATKTGSPPAIHGEEPSASISPVTSKVSQTSSPDTSMSYYFPGIKLTCSLQDLSNKTLISLKEQNKATLCSAAQNEEHRKILAVLCKTVNPALQFIENRDNCTVQLGYSKDHPSTFAVLEVSVKTNATGKYIEEGLKSRTEELTKLGFQLNGVSETLDAYEDKISIPLIITIVCLAAALLLVAAIYSCCHQRQRHKKDQRLTEELQTMENGYHDNPTLDVMETSPEMQEKKPGLNGDLGDSWIVPIDNLTKEDMDDDEEEDTHL
ncbi:podocalyxin [Ambystoma mexicanum]|uniref:podocalyxin n=1 Tax=Ambystoma mexicanum TaxID=8296 RepID=UPI0037E74B9D